MCGIIGYLGDREATPILMESLKRLEYRGYDSAGVAVLADGAGADRRTSVTTSAALRMGARLTATLVVGLAEKEYYVASDIAATSPKTRRGLVLGEGEVAAITPLGPQVYTLDGHTVKPKLIHGDWDATQAQKGGYPHFMLKEINESSEAVANAMRGRLTDDGAVSFREFDVPDEDLKKYREVLLLGMGTSLHAAMIGEQVIEDWAGIPARAEDASEFRYRRPTFGKDTLTVVITQ